jgi:hypothetical protein
LDCISIKGNKNSLASRAVVQSCSLFFSAPLRLCEKPPKNFLINLVCIPNLIKFVLQTGFIYFTIMETSQNHPDSFDENQSIQVIREMIEVSQKKLKNDGILFILWGWISFITYLLEYIFQYVAHTYQVTVFKRYFTTGIAIVGLAFTVMYVFRKSRRVTTYIGVSLRIVWISMFAGMVLINLIQNNVLHKINFELQLPIFMILVSFALVVTGGILRYKMILAAGIVFGLLAYLASFFSLHQQILIQSIAWLIAFVIPGHILHAKRNS